MQRREGMKTLKLATISLLALVLACGRREDQGAAATTAAAIETELQRNGIDGIEVTMNGDMAVLSGIVASEPDRMRAEEIARRRPGVANIQNRLAVRQPPVLTSADDDARTAARLESVLAGRGMRGLHVAITNQEVVITGELPRERRDEMRSIVGRELPTGHRIVDRTEETSAAP